MLSCLSYNKPRWQEINLKTNYVAHVDDFSLAGTDHPAGRKKMIAHPAVRGRHWLGQLFNPGGFLPQGLQTRPTRRIVEQTLRADGYPIILDGNTCTDPSSGFISPLKIEHDTLHFRKIFYLFLKAVAVGCASRNYVPSSTRLTARWRRQSSGMGTKEMASLIASSIPFMVKSRCNKGLFLRNRPVEDSGSAGHGSLGGNRGHLKPGGGFGGSNFLTDARQGLFGADTPIQPAQPRLSRAVSKPQPAGPSALTAP